MKNKSSNRYEVIVVGAGHAGCEAALAAARMGCSTLLLTLNRQNVALMPCNPAVGGPGKAQVVREVDALGGEMALNADRACIQMRLLNTAKGPAVRSLRAQVDKKIYQQEMLLALQRQKNLCLQEALVEKLVLAGDRVEGVETREGVKYRSPAVVLASGTYLRGKIIIGEKSFAGGPAGQPAAEALPRHLLELGFQIARFKTDTPPRLDSRTIDYSLVEEQESAGKQFFFSYLTRSRQLPEVSCWLTYTNEETHAIIDANLRRSLLYKEGLGAAGPRYCPSIEDKILRFRDKTRHQIFLEPEGLDTSEIYVQGMSTSLPENVQSRVIQSIKGLERAEIIRPGYAIEYDYLEPLSLKPTLESKDIAGLFTAGQINGTSGYEEAAGQGVVAGINAVRYLRGEQPVIFKRSEAYLGVLVDDLVTKGTREPYRLLTSRAEFRLLLRQDNADLRLTEKGRELGLVSEERYQSYLQKKERIARELQRLQRTVVKPDQKLKEFLQSRGSSLPKHQLTLVDLLKRPEITHEDLKAYGQAAEEKFIGEAVELQIKYAGYIKKQLEQVKRLEKLESRTLPPYLDYSRVANLRTEAREKLQKIRPVTLGQAGRISGVSPADLNALLVYLQKRKLNSPDD